MNETKKHFQWTLLLVIILCFTLRFLYHQFNQEVKAYNDSLQYISRAQQIARGEPVINPFRFPLYPLLIQSIIPLKNLPDITWGTYRLVSYLPVVMLQQCLGMLAALMIILTAFKLIRPHQVFIIFGILFSFFINLFGFEKNIATENIVVFFFACLILLSIGYMKLDKSGYLFGMLMVFSLLFLLHPLYTYLPFFVYPIISYYLFRQKKFRQLIIIVTMLALFTLLPVFYSQYNNKIYGYNGLSTISEHNLLAKTIQYKLDAYNVPNSSPYYTTLKWCITQHNPTKRIDILDCLYAIRIPDDAYATSSAPIIGKFAKDVILNKPEIFMLKSLSLIPGIIQGTDHDFKWISTYSSHPLLQYVWQVSRELSNLLQFLMLSFLVFFPLHLVRFIKNPNQENTILMVLGMIIAYTLMLTAFFSFDNYSRKIVPVLPWILLFCCYYFQLFLSKLFSFKKYP